MRLRKTLTWIAVLLGIAIGILGLAFLIRFPTNEYSRFSTWPAIASSGLFASVCLAGSFLGLRDRERAATLFLWAVPAWVLLLTLVSFTEHLFSPTASYS